MTFISLGHTCSVAYQLQQLGIRKCAYPFDWVRTPTLDIVSKLLKNNFDQFIDSVKQTKTSDQFPISDDDNFPVKDELGNRSLIMENKYGITFFHDFEEDYDLEAIKYKYERRISRLYDIINDNDKITFVRDEKLNNIRTASIEQFMNTILNINPNANFEIIIVVQNPSNKQNDIFKYANERVKIVNDTTLFVDWKRSNVDWNDILN